MRQAAPRTAADSGAVSANRARQALKLLHVAGDDAEPALPAIELFDDLQIYPGSKLRHFRALHAQTGVPYEQMVCYTFPHPGFMRIQEFQCSCFSTMSPATAKWRALVDIMFLKKGIVANMFLQG